MPPKLAILKQASSSKESTKNPHEPFPIMSISKSFLGAVCVLMAAENNFGINAINSPLSDALEIAKSKYPDRSSEIDKLLQALNEKELSGITFAEILTHKSGIDEEESKLGEYENRVLDLVSEKFVQKGDRGQFRYNNPAYALLEKVIDLTSQSGSFKQELQNRVFNKCNMTETGDMYDLQPSAAAAREKFDPELLKFGSLGRVPFAAGAFYSTADDMQKYAHELARMISGQESMLTEGLDQAQKEQISIAYKSSIDQQSGYSLGIANIAIADNQVKSIYLNGGILTNRSNLDIDLTEDGEIDSKFTVVQFDKNAIRLLENQGVGKSISQYFNSKFLKDSPVSDKPLYQQESYLVEQKLITKEFGRVFYQQICDCYQQIASQIISSSCLKQDGALDSEKLAKDYQKIEREIEQKANEKVRDIFIAADQALSLELEKDAAESSRPFTAAQLQNSAPKDHSK